MLQRHRDLAQRRLCTQVGKIYAGGRNSNRHFGVFPHALQLNGPVKPLGHSL